MAKRTYKVVTPLLHGDETDDADRSYEPGDLIDLDEAQARTLLETGAIKPLAGIRPPPPAARRRMNGHSPTFTVGRESSAAPARRKPPASEV